MELCNCFMEVYANKVKIILNKIILLQYIVIANINNTQYIIIHCNNYNIHFICPKQFLIWKNWYNYFESLVMERSDYCFVQRK